MTYRSELFSAVVTALLYVALFAVVEIWSRRRNPDPEVSRKLVHFGGGMVALFFPVLFRSHWTVLGLAILFVISLIITKRSGKLGSVQGVERVTVGEIIYPLGIWLILFLSTLMGKAMVALYIPSLLILAVADALAGIVGKRFGRRLYAVGGGTKSVEGSAAFFAATAAIIWGTFAWIWRGGTISFCGPEVEQPDFRLEKILLALLLALVLTGVEAVSSKGLDNITLPVAAWGLLALVPVRNSSGGIVPELGVVIAAASVALWLTTRLRWLSVEHAILAVLAGYAIRLMTVLMK